MAAIVHRKAPSLSSECHSDAGHGLGVDGSHIGEWQELTW
jgi:hypothetical protein